MDEYSRKWSVGGFGFSRRGSSLSFREPNNEDKTLPYCNRLGCSTRFNSMKGTPGGSSEKSKYQKTSFRSMNSKAIGESSSKPFASSIDFRKSQKQRPNRSPQQGTEQVMSSSQLGDAEDSEDIESLTSQRSSALSTASSSDSKSLKQINRRVRSNAHDIPSSSSSFSSVRPPIMSNIMGKNMGHVTKPSSQYLGSGPLRYGLKNLSNSSISDVLPSGCPPNDPGKNRRVASIWKRPVNGESSSSGVKGANGSSSGSLMPQQVPRKARNRPISKDGPVSVRTRRAPKGETRVRLSEQQNDNILSVSEPLVYPQLPHSQLTIREIVPESPSRSFPSSFGGRLNSSGRSARSRLISSHPEDGATHGSLGDRDGYQHFNMEGIAEVLLALERIEQDDELTYEQLLVLETNLFLGGLGLHDQHRDMRLDIDNMTYEELLALEEKMGNVSTALSEEALSKCLTRSNYLPACESPGITARGDDDIKCSVCQEEYVIGDEVGKLACDHRYHMDCIQQWLRQKNWCPICKTAAASTNFEGRKE